MEFDYYIVLKTILVVLILSIIGFFVFDLSMGERKYYIGTIVDKIYIPSVTSTGVGYGMRSDGKTGTIVTTNRTQEKRNVFVKSNKGISEIRCGTNVYYEVETGTKVKVSYREGKWTGFCYAENIYEIIKGD